MPSSAYGSSTASGPSTSKTSSSGSAFEMPRAELPEGPTTSSATTLAAIREPTVAPSRATEKTSVSWSSERSTVSGSEVYVDSASDSS